MKKCERCGLRVAIVTVHDARGCKDYCAGCATARLTRSLMFPRRGGCPCGHIPPQTA